MPDAEDHDSDRTARPQNDASAGWRAEYSHQGVRFVGAFTSRNADHANVAGPHTGVSLSDYANGEGESGNGDVRNVEGDQ